MPLTIELPDDISSLLEDEARAEGRTPGELAAFLLRQVFATAPRGGSGTAPNAAAKPYQTFVAPLDGKPIEQVINEQREKHGFPPDWGTSELQMTDETRLAIDQAFREMYPDFRPEEYEAENTLK